MKPFLLTCLALLAVTVFGVRLIAWADTPKELPLLIQQTVAEKPAPAELQPDIVGRAKFAAVDADVIDRISYINRFVNANVRGVSDLEQYHEPELWVMAPVSMAGDCEDMALTKLYMLVNLGYPELAMRIVALAVDKSGDQFGHAILEIILPDGSHAFLDNLHSDLMTKAELQADGYEFVPWGD